MTQYPKLQHDKEVVRRQTERKKLKDGIFARFLVTSVSRAVFDKEERSSDKRGSCAVVLVVSPLKDQRDARTIDTRFSTRVNIILPIKNPDHPEHKEPNTTFICQRWAKALFPEQLPPTPIANPLKKQFELSAWDDTGQKYVPTGGCIKYGEDEALRAAQLEVDNRAVALMAELFNDEDKLKGLKGLAFYGVTKSQGGFQNVDDPTVMMPKGKQYGPIEPEEEKSNGYT